MSRRKRQVSGDGRLFFSYSFGSPPRTQTVGKCIINIKCAKKYAKLLLLRPFFATAKAVSILNLTPCPRIKRLLWQLKAKVGLDCGPILDFYFRRLLNDPPMSVTVCLSTLLAKKRKTKYKTKKNMLRTNEK